MWTITEEEEEENMEDMAVADIMNIMEVVVVAVEDMQQPAVLFPNTPYLQRNTDPNFIDRILQADRSNE